MMFLWFGKSKEEYMLEPCGDSTFKFTRATSKGDVTYTYNLKELCERRTYASDGQERVISFEEF